ncbi:MAG: 6-phosphogluconolactonase [Oceanicoccus sp.]|jgi:6-phosphogluconolactonase
MSPSLFPYESSEAFYEAALEDLQLFIKETLSEQKVCRIVLAGGSTPKPLYEMMALADFPWERLHFTVMDERYVPSDHEESNLKMMRRALFNKVPLSPEQVLSFDTSLPYESAAKEMQRRIAMLQNERRPLFDLLILGAGADGHIASLFTLSDLDNQRALCTKAEGYPSPQRLSLGMGALSQAKKAMLLLKGQSKREIVNSLKNPSLSTPVEVISEKLPTKVYYCEIESSHT